MSVATALLLVIYFLPSLVSVNRKRENTGAIIALNLFAGWTFIGWIVALVWASTMDDEERAIRRAKRKY